MRSKRNQQTSPESGLTKLAFFSNVPKFDRIPTTRPFARIWWKTTCIRIYQITGHERAYLLQPHSCHGISSHETREKLLHEDSYMRDTGKCSPKGGREEGCGCICSKFLSSSFNSSVKKARSPENLLGAHNQSGTKHAVTFRPQAFAKTVVLRLFCGMLSIFNFPSRHTNDHEGTSGRPRNLLEPDHGFEPRRSEFFLTFVPGN